MAAELEQVVCVGCGVAFCRPEAGFQEFYWHAPRCPACRPPPKPELQLRVERVTGVAAADPLGEAWRREHGIAVVRRW
jgi:hypothetical protein